MCVKERGSDSALLRIALIALFSPGVLAFCPTALAAEPPASPAAQQAPGYEAAREAEAVEGASARGALLVHVNVDAGTIALRPMPGSVPLELSANTLNALDTSFEGLTSVERDGVTSLALQGRFSSVWLTLVDSSGKARAFCVTALPPEIAAAARALRQKSSGRRERGDATHVR